MKDGRLAADRSIRSQEGSAIKGKKGYIELKNTSQGVYFTTKTLKGLNDDHKDVNKQYERKQSSLVKEVIGIAGASRLRIPARWLD